VTTTRASPLSPRGRFGILSQPTSDGEGEEDLPTFWVRPTDGSANGSSAVLVTDLPREGEAADGFPEVIIANKSSDTVRIYWNGGATQVSEDETRWEGFLPAQDSITVGDAPVDVEIDSGGNIWVLNQGDGTVTSLTSSDDGSPDNPITITTYASGGNATDRELVDADNDGVGDSLGVIDAEILLVGRASDNTYRAYMTFQISDSLIEAVQNGQLVKSTTLRMTGVNTDPDIGYDVNLFVADQNHSNGNAQIDYFEDTDFTQLDSNANPYLAGGMVLDPFDPDYQVGDNAGDGIIRISFNQLNEQRIQEAIDTGNRYLTFRLQGDHPLFGLDEDTLTDQQLDELNALQAYRLDSGDTTTVAPATLTFLLTEDLEAGDEYLAGDNPTSLAVGDATGNGEDDLVIVNTGSDEILIYEGDGTVEGFGEPDADGDTFREPTFQFSTNRPDFYVPSSPDIDGDTIFDPIPDDSNPMDVAIGDIDGDEVPDVAIALQGSMFPGTTFSTSTGVNLTSHIPGGVAIFWGTGGGYQDYDPNRPDTQPDFLQDSLLGNQPTPVVAEFYEPDVLAAILGSIEVFYRGPQSIQIANMDPAYDFNLGPQVALNDLVVGSIDPFNTAKTANPFIWEQSTRGGAFILNGRYDPQVEYDNLIFATPFDGFTNAPIIGGTNVRVHGRIFATPLRLDTDTGYPGDPDVSEFVPNPPSNPVKYVDVLVVGASEDFPLGIGGETLTSELVEGDIDAPDLVITRTDNQSPYWLDFQDETPRNARVLLQAEGEPDQIPVYNDGIGQLIINGADENTRLTIIAGEVNALFDGDSDFVISPVFFQPDTPLTQSDIPLDVLGWVNGAEIAYPTNAGRILIGSPEERPLTRVDATYHSPQGLSYRNPTYGIKVEGDQSMDRVLIDGRVLGQNIFGGSVEVFSAGFLAGDLIIDGDANLINIATDSGYIPSGDSWDADVLNDEYTLFGSNNTIEVGRSLRELNVGGALYSQVTALGETGDPVDRPPLDQLRLYEYEVTQPTTTTTIQTGPTQFTAYSDIEHSYIRTPGVAMGPDFVGGTSNDPIEEDATQFGSALYTVAGAPLSNGTINEAQFVGGSATSALLAGWLDIDAGDIDYYAFVADYGQTVTISFTNEALIGQTIARDLQSEKPFITVVDRDNNVLATMENGTSQFTFTAPHAGAFYLRLETTGDEDPRPLPYTIELQNIAPVNLGMVRSNNVMIVEGSSGSIQALGGSIGLIAAGASPAPETTTEIQDYTDIDGADIEDILGLIGFSVIGGIQDGITSAENIYGITIGGDMIGTTINAPGTLGNIYVGTQSIGDEDEGADVGDFTESLIKVGDLAYADFKGSFAGEATGVAEDDGARTTGGIVTTGSMGSIYVREVIWGTEAFFTIGDNSTLDLLVVDAFAGTEEGGDDDVAPLEPRLGIRGQNPVFTTGANSDIRFLDIPNSRFNQVPGDFTRVLEAGESVEFVDDSGAEFTIRLTGGDAAQAIVTFFEVNGSQGVVVGQIGAALDGGRLLVDSTRRDATTSIGRIITTSSVDNSSIVIDGSGEVDVYRIDAYAADEGDGVQETAYRVIQNKTRDGDIVAVDAISLDKFEIASGELGLTQTNGVGPARFGPLLGILNGLDAAPVSAVGTQIPYFNAAGPDTNAAPFDPWLNGLVVRTGDVSQVKVAGSLGDVIVPAGEINRAIADSDRKVEPDGFDGVIGSVYANYINRIDIGSGLVHEGESHFATAGIFSVSTIERIDAKGVGNDIEGLIISHGQPDPDAIDNTIPGEDPEPGRINRIQLSGGASIIGADIMNSGFAAWFQHPIGDAVRPFSGDINRIDVRGGEIFGTTFYALNINRIDAKKGAWDASIAVAQEEISSIKAGEFRNSLNGGRINESPHNSRDVVSFFDPNRIGGPGFVSDTILYSNFIRTSRELGTLQAKGDIHDLVVEIGGDVTGKIGAQDIVRSEFGVTETLGRLDAKGSILASEITVGEVRNVQAKDSIRTTSITAAGPIDRVDAKQGEILNSSIVSDGVDGLIGRIQAKTRIENVTIDSAGPISQVKARTGDVNVDLRTIGGGEADLGTVEAGRDIRGSFDVDGDIGKLKAKENIGTDPALIPAGSPVELISATHDLDQIDAKGGQIYTEIRVLGRQTGTIKTGDVVTRDGAEMSPSTASYTFAGSINRFDSTGAFDATLISQSGGIGTLNFNGGFGATAMVVAQDAGISSMSVRGTYTGSVFADEDINSFSVNGTVTGGSITTDQTLRSATFTSGVSNLTVMAGLTIGNLNLRSAVTDTILGAGELIDKATISGLATDVSIVAGLNSLGTDGALGGGDDVVSSGDINNLNLAGGSTRVNVLAGWDVGNDRQVDPDGAIVDDVIADGLSTIRDMSAGGVITDSAIRADTSAPAVAGFDTQSSFMDPEPAPSENAVRAGTPRTFTFAVNDPDSGAPAILNLTLTYTGAGYANLGFVDNGATGFTPDDRLNSIEIYGSDRNSSLTVSSVLSVTGQEDRTGFAHLATEDLAITGGEDRWFGTFAFDGDLTGAATIEFDGNVRRLEAMDLDSTGTQTFHAALDQLALTQFSDGDMTIHILDSAEITGGFTGVLNAYMVGDITIDGGFSGRINVTEDLGRLQTGAFENGSVRARGSIDQLTAASMYRGIVSAGDELGQVRVNGNVDDSFFLAGEDLGPDGAFGGGDDDLSNGSIGSVTVSGNFTRSDVVAGVARGVDGFHNTSDDSYASGLSTVGRVSIAGAQVGSNVGSESYTVMSNGTVATVTVAGKATFGKGNFRVGAAQISMQPVQVESIRTEIEGDTYTTYIAFNQDLDVSRINDAITITNEDATPSELRLGVDYNITYDENDQTVVIEFEPFVGQSPSFGQTDNIFPPGVYTITIDADPTSGIISRTQDRFFDGNGDGVITPGGGEPDFVRGVLIGDAGDRINQYSVVIDNNDTPIDPADDTYVTLYEAPNLSNADILVPNETLMLEGVIGNHPDENVLLFPDRLDIDVYAINVQAGDIVRVRLDSAEGLFDVSLRGATDGGVSGLGEAIPGTSIAQTAATGSLEDGYVFRTAGTYYITVVPLDIAIVPANLPPLVGHGTIIYNGILDDSPLETGDVGEYTLQIDQFRDGDTGFGDGAGALYGTVLDTTDGAVTVDAAIGPQGFVGRPDEAFYDADVFHLNNGNPLAAGSTINVSLLLSDLGADIGTTLSDQLVSPNTDSPGVELAIFDVTDATNFSDALLVAAPTINANGDRLTGDTDFSYSIVVPGAQDGTPGTPNTGRIYAVMVQGSQRADYQLQVSVTEGNGNTPARTGQNVLIELGGGTIDWLENYGTTDLEAFDLGVFGLAGSESTVVDQLIANLETQFGLAGVSVTFSTSAAAFENEDFTTVFLTSSFAPQAFNDQIEYGFNDGIDVLNTNKNQEAVVFVPRLSNVRTNFGAQFSSLINETELAAAMSNVVAKELAETFGLRELHGGITDAAGPGNPGIADDTLMVENSPAAWIAPLNFNIAADPTLFVQLDPAEFLLGAQNALMMLDAALAD
jgi:hypothetical protein